MAYLDTGVGASRGVPAIFDPRMAGTGVVTVERQDPPHATIY